MPDGRPSPIRGYLLALIAVALAAVARASVDSLLDGFPFATFFGAVVAIAWFVGAKAALLATLLSTVAGSYLFTQPRYQFTLDGRDVGWIAFFAGASAIVSVLADRFQQTRARLRQVAEAEVQQAQEMLAERKRLGDLIDSIPGIVWEAWGEPDSLGQRIEYVNDYAEAMVGYTAEEWTSRPNFWLQLVHPDDREQAARVAAEMFAAGRPGENEFRWITKDGRTIWVLARSTTITDEHGAPIGMRGVTFDITQRKEIEQRLSLLSEISTTGLTTLPFNELASRIAHRTAQVVGEYCVIRMLRDGQLETVAYAHADPVAEPMLRALATHSTLVAQQGPYADIVRAPRTIIENDLGEEVFAQVDRTGAEEVFERFRARRAVYAPLFSQGTMVGTLAIGRAVGPPFTAADGQFAEAIAARASLAFENARLVEVAQRDAEQAQHARREAEEAGRVKDEFLATLSHELRTPLNAILGWAHMLRDPRLPPERRQTAIETILRNAQSQEQLISDMLDVQRIGAGKIRLNVRRVDLGSVVRAAAETVQPSADAKNIRVQLLLDPPAPAITGDPDRLQQVVWNLLSNAIKFAPRGGHVRVRLGSAGDHCELVVEDDGPGINPDFMPHMFERFRQADSSTTRTHRGLGLGLAIVRSLVEMHGGTIAAANTTVAGATGAAFTIRLPREITLAARAAVGDAPGDGEPAWMDQTPSLEGVQVLVVEDDYDVRELLGTILQRCGAQVRLTASVPEGLTAFDEQRPDVIVSDIEMAKEDGYSFIRRIRALRSDDGGDVPAAALTAYATPSDRQKILGAGFNMHVAKPVQPAELALVVANLAARPTQKPFTSSA